MNILFLNQLGHIAGSTLSVTYLAKGLADRGHTVLVGCEPFSQQSLLLAGSKVRAVHFSIRHNFDTKAIGFLRDVVAHEQIDVVNAQSSRDRHVSIFSKWLTQFPALVVHTRRQMPEMSGGRLQAWFYTHGTSAIIAVSEPVKQRLVKKGIPAEHIHIIHNGTPREKYESLDQSRVAALRERYGIGPDTNVIGCVARPHKQKYHRQLLEALKFVETPVTLLFVGTEKKASFSGLINAIANKHTVHFCGLVPPQESLQHFGLFTLFILPSTMEGLSQSILEAMALGIPVIATRAGGNVDCIQDSQNGFLFQDKDVRGLAQHIEHLLSDPKLRETIGSRGRRTALEDFTIERTIDHHERLFHSLVPSYSNKRKSVGARIDEGCS